MKSFLLIAILGFALLAFTAAESGYSSPTMWKNNKAVEHGKDLIGRIGKKITGRGPIQHQGGYN